MRLGWVAECDGKMKVHAETKPGMQAGGAVIPFDPHSDHAAEAPSA